MTRARVALALYGLGAALLLVPLSGSLWGWSWTGALGPLRLSVGSWSVLRFIVPVLLSAYALDPERHARLSRWAGVLARRRALVLAALVAFGCALAVIYKVTQHLGFRTGGYDLSLYQWALDFTLHGRFMWAFGLERSFLEEHASLILLALVPLYALAPSALTLVVVEALGFALAVVPMYGLARAAGCSRAVSAAAAALLFANVFLWRGLGFDFHPELLMPLLVLGAAWAAVRARWVWFWLAALAALLVREDMALVMLPLAAWVALKAPSGRLHAALLAVVALAWTVVAVKLVLPPHSRFLERYGAWGTSWSTVAVSLLTSPLATARLLLSPPSLALLLSTGGMSLLRPRWLLAALPALLVPLASNLESQRLLQLYYGVPAVTVLLLEVPAILASLERRWSRWNALALAAFALAVQPGVLFATPVTGEDLAAHRYLSSLRLEGPVAAQLPVVPHLPVSESVRFFPRDEVKAQWLLLMPARRTWPLSPEEFQQWLGRALTSGEWGVARWQDGVLLLLRGGATEGNAGVRQQLRL